MRKVIITPALMEKGLGQLTTGEVVELFPLKCSFSGVGVNKGYLVNGEVVAEDMVDVYCQSKFGYTWDEHLHRDGFGEFIPHNEREDYLEHEGLKGFTDDINHYTEWSLDGIENGENVYSAGGEEFEAVVLDHNDVMSVISSLPTTTRYVFINLRVQDGERSHQHRCLLQVGPTEIVEDAVEDFVKDFWGDSEKIQDGQYESWGGEIIITLDNYKLITKELYDTLHNLFYSTI